MNFEESISYVHSLLKFGIRPGLSRMNSLLSYLGNPEKDLRFVHIAGTNGKGSTATALANILSEAGYKTGLYTSPYVARFLERIQVDLTPVSEELFAEAVTEIVPYIEKVQDDDAFTEFELITAAAFLCFKWENCDITVLEVGLGGRLDATNVIKKPAVEIITSLSLDHTAILGNTIEKIAYEKCGIIKDDTSVVCSYGQEAGALDVIRKTVAERGCELIIPDADSLKILHSDIFGTDFIYKSNQYRLNMAGEHQLKNMTAAIEAAQVLNKNEFKISQKNFYDGISKTVLLARIEILQKNPLVILDGGHNTDGISALVKLLKSALPDKKLTVILGMMADKDVDACVKLLCEISDRIICVTPENARAIKASRLAEIAEKYCCNTFSADMLTDVYPDILKTLKEDEALLICGSLYLAGEVKQIN